MINEELLEEVLGDILKQSDSAYEYTISGELGKDNIFHVNYMTTHKQPATYSINIYQLAYYCKEWAKDEYGYDIYTYKKFGVGLKDEYFANDAFTEELDFTKGCDTEPEAIFLACQYILDSK